MYLKLTALAAIGAVLALDALGATTAGSTPVTDTFALCQLVGAERATARTLSAGTIRDYTRPAVGSVFALKVFLPATVTTGEWTLLPGIQARPLADRLTAEVVVAGGKTRFTLPLDAWHRLVLARGRAYLAEHDLGPITAGSSLRLGGGAALHCTDGQSPQLKSDREIDEFISGLPPAFRSWVLPADRRRIAKGQSVKFEHGLVPTNTTPYTLVADVKLPPSSWNQWRSVYTVATNVDGAAFINTNNLFGNCGQYVDMHATTGSVHRIAVVHGNKGVCNLYWDGLPAVSCNTSKSGLRGPWLYLGGDDNGEDGEIEIGQILLYDQPLDANTVKKLGGCK